MINDFEEGLGRGRPGTAWWTRRSGDQEVKVMLEESGRSSSPSEETCAKALDGGALPGRQVPHGLEAERYILNKFVKVY
eukprot:5460355-Heterocapsa_arctica.AAC.1